MSRNQAAPDIRIAIISDPHLGFLGHGSPNYYGLGQPGDQSKWLEYALKYFKHRGIDAFVCPGDMANACAYRGVHDGMTGADRAVIEMADFGKVFKSVFGGTDTELVTIYGNHDNLCQHRERLNGGDSSPWEEAFGTPYTHINKKTVKGFTFIGANWGYEAEARAFIKEAAEADPDRAVFYIQHGEIKNTTCDTRVGNESSVGIDNIRDYDNVIALFGHTHCPITDERTVWQSAKDGDPRCTVISCGSFNYGYSPNELTRGEDLMTKHALYLTVTGKEVRIERLSFWTPEMLALAKGEKTEQDLGACTRSAGADWCFTVGGERVLDCERRAADTEAPEFPKGAMAGLARSNTAAVIFFPAAIPIERNDDMLHSYSVDVFLEETGELVTTVNISAENHVDHSNEHYTPYYQIVVTELEPDTKYIFKVYARNSFLKRSKTPIIHVGRTLAERRERFY